MLNKKICEKLSHPVFKRMVFCVALYPVFRWLYLILQNDLTANPTEFLMRSSGLWTLVLLCITLTMTPLRHLSGCIVFILWRRMLGLFSLFYAVLHIMMWFWWDRNWSFNSAWQDIMERPFVSVGLIAFMGLVILGLTSNAYSIKTLGKYWQRLHRVVYLILILAIIHFWLHKAGKNDFSQPMIYSGIAAILLVSRVYFWIKKRTKRFAKKSAMKH